MSDGENRAVGEFRVQRLLNDFVRFHVDRRRRFVENEYSRFAQKCSSQTDELTLTNTRKNNLKNNIRLFFRFYLRLLPPSGMIESRPRSKSGSVCISLAFLRTCQSSASE